VIKLGIQTPENKEERKTRKKERCLGLEKFESDFDLGFRVRPQRRINLNQRIDPGAVDKG